MYPNEMDVFKGFRSTEDLIAFVKGKLNTPNSEDRVAKLEQIEAGLARGLAVNKRVSDAAMNGGIDFAQSNLDLQIKRDGAGVPLPISQQNLDNIHIDGLVPVILNIRPAADVSLGK